MVKFTAIIQRFSKNGEKTGWTYIDVPTDIAQKLKPGNRQSFKVKGSIDEHPIEMKEVMPAGGGVFIFPLNAEIRKAIGKTKGAAVTLKFELDKREYKQSLDMLDCIAQEPQAMETFKKMSRSNQNYFSKWIESAKTEETKAKRIAMTVNGLALGLNYGEMIRHYQKLKN
jgi:hypothetical protein